MSFLLHEPMYENGSEQERNTEIRCTSCDYRSLVKHTKRLANVVVSMLSAINELLRNYRQWSNGWQLNPAKSALRTKSYGIVLSKTHRVQLMLLASTCTSNFEGKESHFFESPKADTKSFWQSASAVPYEFGYGNKYLNHIIASNYIIWQTGPFSLRSSQKFS